MTDRNYIIAELNRTTSEVPEEVRSLTAEQWVYKQDNEWSILEIIEHLEMQNQLHFRELSVLVNSVQNN